MRRIALFLCALLLLGGWLEPDVADAARRSHPRTTTTHHRTTTHRTTTHRATTRTRKTVRVTHRAAKVKVRALRRATVRASRASIRHAHPTVTHRHAPSSHTTYRVGTTHYYVGQTFRLTGRPKVARSETAKHRFLKSLGYDRVPPGYEVDHIIPLFEGGADDPSNMQLLPKSVHHAKTAREREAIAHHKKH